MGVPWPTSAGEPPLPPADVLRQFFGGASPSSDQPLPGHGAAVPICWGPNAAFSAVAVTATVPYGPVALVARYDHPPLSRRTQLRVSWYLDDGPEPVSVGDYELERGDGHFDAAMLLANQAINPGTYRAVFAMAGQEVGSGQLRITPPQGLDGRDPAEVYLTGLNALQAALQAVDRADAKAAEGHATAALPALATAMAASRQLPDTVATHELAQAVIAVGRMSSAAERGQKASALEWASRALAHARNVQNWASDAQLKSTAKQIADTMGRALPTLRDAARQ